MGFASRAGYLYRRQEKMKIVHVIEYFQPKMGYQETYLAREHGKLGHDVCVVTSDRYNPIIFEGDATRQVLGDRIVKSGFFQEEGINVWRLKTLFEIPPVIWTRGLEKKIRELKPDVVIMHNPVSFAGIRIARLKKSISFKLIYDDHMTFAASRSKLRFLYPLFTLLFSKLIQQSANALVGVSEASRDFMHYRYGIAFERITVIPLGANIELFQLDAAARSEVRNKLAIPNDNILFIYAGKLIPDKGPHLLVEAATKLMSKHSNINVLILGSGGAEYLGKMKQHIRNGNLEDRFFWHDAVPNKELHKFYSAADVAVWPREGSLSIMEAMACKLPVIISDTSLVDERVGYGNGLTYAGEDPADLARQMEKLLDSDTRRRMGANGRKAVEESLNWKTIARQFLELAA
jgi:glycosyltransferase involved in cell wall biosynthesis